MSESPSSDVTRLLVAWQHGHEEALERLIRLVYAELHRLAHSQMAGERAGHTLQTTALVHEKYLRLVDLCHVVLEDWLVGTPANDEQMLALDEVLGRLAATDQRRSRVVELRYFGGLTVQETAAVLGVSAETVTRDWKVARLWLLHELKGDIPVQAHGD